MVEEIMTLNESVRRVLQAAEAAGD